MPVRQAIEQGLDIITEQLANVILAVQKETGVDEDEDGQEGDGADGPDGNGFVEPNGYGGYDAGGYGQQGGQPGWAAGGTGMSPLRR